MTEERNKQNVNWRKRYRPYIVAFALAVVMTILVFPEINEGINMEPAIKDEDVLIVKNESYSTKRGIPEKGDIIVLEKPFSSNYSNDNIIARVYGLPGDTIKLDDGSKVVVEKDKVFLKSDNPKGDFDSINKKMGQVPLEEIKGKVLIRIWPISDFGKVN